jgi:hypothetical protein
MKKIFVCIVLLISFVAPAQVLEKPQLVEKIDTSVKITTEVGDVEAPIEVTEVWGLPDVVNRQTPQFPGGQDSLDRYLKDAVERFIFSDTNDTFPWGESVFVAFEISSDGKVTSPFIEMGYNALLDSAALEIVRNMPSWIAATDDNGTPITSTYRLQILFDLDLEIEPSDFDFDLDDASQYSKKGHWAGIEFGLQMNTNGFLDPANSFATAPYWENKISKSMLLNLNAFQYKFNLVKDRLGLITGYGINFSATELLSSNVLVHNADTVYAVINNDQAYKRNTLHATYLTVPILFEFTANQDKPFKKQFYFDAGVIGGLRLYSHQRLTGTYANGDDFENKTKAKFNLNTWMLDATVRMGYGHFGLFANYAILSMFKEGTTVGVYPMRFGVSFNIPQ